MKTMDLALLGPAVGTGGFCPAGFLAEPARPRCAGAMQSMLRNLEQAEGCTFEYMMAPKHKTRQRGPPKRLAPDHTPASQWHSPIEHWKKDEGKRARREAPPPAPVRPKPKTQRLKQAQATVAEERVEAEAAFEAHISATAAAKATDFYAGFEELKTELAETKEELETTRGELQRYKAAAQQAASSSSAGGASGEVAGLKRKIEELEKAAEDQPELKAMAENVEKLEKEVARLKRVTSLEEAAAKEAAEEAAKAAEEAAEEAAKAAEEAAAKKAAEEAAAKEAAEFPNLTLEEEQFEQGERDYARDGNRLREEGCERQRNFQDALDNGD